MKTYTALMPYGDVCIDVYSKDEVVNFIKKSCEECHLKNGENFCNKDLADRCDLQKRNVISAFVRKTNSFKK